MQYYTVLEAKGLYTVAAALERLLADVTFFCPKKLLLCLGSKRAPLTDAKVSKGLKKL